MAARQGCLSGELIQSAAAIFPLYGHPRRVLPIARRGSHPAGKCPPPPHFTSHPEESLPDVRTTDARNAEILRREGVILCFQVILYKVEPRKDTFARNLLSNNALRFADTDEVVECRPEVPLVSKPSSFACAAERLARTTSSPDGNVVGPSGSTESITPDTDSSEEVALGISHKVAW